MYPSSDHEPGRKLFQPAAAEPQPVASAPLGRVAMLLALGFCLGAGTCGLVTPLVESSLEQMAVSTLGIELFLGFVALAGAAGSGEPPASRLGLQPGGIPISLVVLAVVGTLGLSHAVDSALSFADLRDQSVLSQLDAELAGAGGRALLLAFVGLAIAPSIAEELLCRGLLQRGLARRCGGALAVGISAVVFGALHLEWIQGGAATLLGAYLGTISLLAGSIRPAIVCHGVNNLVALLIGISGQTHEPEAVTTALGSALAVAALVALFAHHQRR